MSKWRFVYSLVVVQCKPACKLRPDEVNYLILRHFYSKIDEGMRLFFLP